MGKRLLQAGSVAVPVLIAWAWSPGASWLPGWWLPALGAAPALLWLVATRRSIALWLVAASLAGLATQSAAQARVLWTVSSGEGFVDVDLREGALPDPAPAYVRALGYTRSGWTLDEYAVAPGGLPQQDETPVAVLVPMLGDRGADDGADASEAPEGRRIQPGTAIVVARVSPNAVLRAGDIAQLSGKTSPLDPQLLRTLVQVEGDPASVRGIVLDTLAVPSAQDAWLEVGLAALALLVAVACAFVATAAPPS